LAHVTFACWCNWLAYYFTWHIFMFSYTTLKPIWSRLRNDSFPLQIPIYYVAHILVIVGYQYSHHTIWNFLLVWQYRQIQPKVFVWVCESCLWMFGRINWNWKLAYYKAFVCARTPPNTCQCLIGVWTPNLHVWVFRDSTYLRLYSHSHQPHLLFTRVNIIITLYTKC
jgi:hypothetical protein